MPLSDFDPLLGELAKAFGEYAVVRQGQYRTTIKGRFIVDPYEVGQPPAENGINVTTTKFSYDARNEYALAVPGAPGPPRLHDLLIIRGIEYEIVNIDKDDLGEHALSLLQTQGAR